MSRALAALVLTGSIAAAACAPSAPPDGSLPCDPSIDVQRAAGFDLALEASLPLAAFAETPSTVDSGRECSEKRLGPLWGSGLRELRSAGAIFERENLTGFSVVTYQGVGLTLDALAYAFERGAVTGRKTQDIRIESAPVGTWEGSRMTLLNGDRRQVIVLFQVDGEVDQVRGLLTSDLSNEEIESLLARYEAALR
ncbi:MAG: hypothetical protein RL006_266 [Chloroflexota bacterium]|jgi:hypothetical protein